MVRVRAIDVLAPGVLVALGVCAAGETRAAQLPSPDSGASGLSEVVITGSRIPIEPRAGTTPVTVLSQEDLKRGGLDTLGRVLQTLPYNTGAPMNTNVNDGDGSERVDLRGLGPGRTLLLLNGRRFPNGGLGGDDSADLSQIPLSMIARVEVMTSGAAAIYGADGVAGVINIITRSAGPGVEAAIKGSAAAQGDGSITSASLVLGRAFGAGAWSIGADYLNQEPVTFTARPYSAFPMKIANPDGTRQIGGTSPIPDGVFGVPADNALGLDEGLYVRIPGATGQSAADYRLRNKKSDVYFLAPYEYLQTPTHHGSVWLLGSQPLNESVTLFAEALWNRRDSAQRTAPTPIFSGLSPLPSLGQGLQGIPAGNWYNPFGADILYLRRRLVELPDRSHDQHIEAWRALVGVRGGGSRWRWELAGATAKSTSHTTDIGLPSSLRLIPALGPSGPDAQGHIVCGVREPATGIVPAANIIAGCVPLNLFGGAGSITPEQVNYINTDLHDVGSGSNQLFDFNAEGPWGELPAGPLHWAVGAEYRREQGSYRLDPLRRAGVTGEDIPTEISGANYQTRELYLEARAPLLNGRPEARSLDLSLGLRYSDYSSFGGNSALQAGLRWRPLAAWSLRASYAQVFRAPNLSELYASQFLVLSQGFDPCGQPTPAQRINCAANGVPGGAYPQDPAAEWGQLYGGNPRLAPERGSSFDAGVELTPAGAPGLRADIDYFRVDLDEYIEAPAADDILLDCANHGTPAICALIHRASDGTLLQVDTLQRNFGHTQASGYDGALDYAFRMAGFQFNLGALVSYLERRDTELLRGEGARQLAGSVGFPHWRGNAHLDATRGRWRAGYALQYVGVQTQCSDGLGDPPQTVCFPVGSVLYHDLEAAFDVRPGFKLRAGILNLTDRYPPFVDGGGPNTDVASYRLLGRSYYAALEFRH